MKDEKMPEGAFPGCEWCWKKEECPRAENGKFCPEWQSREPEKDGPDPNELWNIGEGDIW